MFEIIIKPLAEIDLTEASIWYESKKLGLGDEFLFAIETKLNSIQNNPYQFQVVRENIHRALCLRFPYSIFYVV